MQVAIVTPMPPGSTRGNRITATRYAALLTELGHRVCLVEQLQDEPCDVVLALHARRSAPSIERGAARGVPVVVVLTGTDLYPDIAADTTALRSLALADRLVVLHADGAADLPSEHRGKVVAIPQSVAVPDDLQSEQQPGFSVCVLGHLRDVKDPLRCAAAVRALPEGSRLQVVHLGAALSEEWAAQARAEERSNPRYRWHGPCERQRALGVLAGCRLHVNTSRLEGGANAIGEAVVLGVPSVVSAIASSRGLLGSDYPAVFPVGDTAALRAQLLRCEREASFYAALVARTRARAAAFAPAAERAALRQLLVQL